MELDEGYIKFNIHWDQKESVSVIPNDILFWRDKMHENNLIGELIWKGQKIGFGNTSVFKDEKLLISGSQTGAIYPSTKDIFTTVTNYNIANNEVWCSGPVKASSETLTHAAIYEADPSIKAVIHVHHKQLWEHALKNIPCTDANIPFGTPEMAKAFKKIISKNDFNILPPVIGMRGHEDGLVAFGASLEVAGKVLLKMLKNLS